MANPKTGPPEFARRRAVGLGEGLKKPFLSLCRDSDAGITDFKPQLAFPLIFLVTGNPYSHFSHLGKLDRVPHQISQHLPYPPGIAAEPRWDGGLDQSC